MKIYQTLIMLTLLLAPFILANDDLSDSAASSTNTAASQNKNTPASAFIASFSTIIVSEFGDRTFFIAAIMSMRYNRIAVLSGIAIALFLMTAISTAFGTLVTTLIPAFYTHVITTGLFFFFGFKLLYDAYYDEEEENNEKSEVEMELNELHTKMMEKKSRASINQSQIEQVAVKLVFWQAFTLTFLGEWGDRSQISTIALAANSNALIVFLGSFLGNYLCTCLAVMGGKYLAKRISERAVNICGGALFLIFGLHNIFIESS